MLAAAGVLTAAVTVGGPLPTAAQQSGDRAEASTASESCVSLTVPGVKPVVVGSVCTSVGSGALTVTYTTTDGWALVATNLSVTATLAEVPLDRTGMPSVARFPLRASHAAGVTTYSHVVGLAGANLGAEAVIAAQADISRVKNRKSEAGSAWAAGTPFVKRANAATWFLAPLLGPPTASFTATPVSGTAPLTVAFDATGSSDADGTIEEYRWDFGDASAVDTNSGATVSHTYTAAGTYTATLTVTDDDGATASTTVEITVTPAPIAPTASFTANPTSGTAPLIVAFDATGSSDADGTIVEFSWDFGDESAVDTGSGATVSHTFEADGRYTVTLTVTDDDGLTDTATVELTVGNPPPPFTSPLAASESGTCALVAGGAVKCWGSNFAGELGLGDLISRGNTPATVPANLPTVDLGTDGEGNPLTATAIVGRGHYCALFTNGKMKCWGSNGEGQLGLATGYTFALGDEPNEMGDNLPYVDLGTGRTVTAIAAGQLHTCALLDGGDVKCWGYGFYGALGLGDEDNRGYFANEMGDNLPTVDLGVDGEGRPLTATAIFAGPWHTCAILEGGDVKCWGDNDFGQLGLGDVIDRGQTPETVPANLPTLDLGTGRTAVSISGGSTHTCAVLDNGTAKCWGENYYGQLGLGDANSRGDGPNEMGDALPAMRLGDGFAVAAVSVGNDYTCAVSTAGAVKCVGRNAFGSLGIGTTLQYIGDEASEVGNNMAVTNLGTGLVAAVISSGGYHNCVQFTDGGVKCWGFNLYGQLGLGDALTRGDEPNEMGDDLPMVVLVTPT